jgi:hypothetical protein
MNRVRKIIASLIMLLLAGIIMQPAAAWGELTHVVIVSKLQPNENDKLLMNNNPKFAKGGALGPDIFYFSSNTDFSVLAHTQNTSQLPREMMAIASRAPTETQRKQQRAYVDGWWSHFASDIRGHRDYVNTFDPSVHTDVEVGVDANLVREVSDYSFSVPYGLVQTAYGEVYGSIPTTTEISVAVRTQQTAIFLERMAIALGIYNTQKRTYNGFRDEYDRSIIDSENAINHPPTQDYDLNTGYMIITASIASLPVYIQTDSKKFDKELIDAANELIESGAVEVAVEDDKKNQVIHVNEPVIKNRKKFNQVLDYFVRIKKDKKS